MTDFIILGTDTDAGKTTFALLWLQLFAADWEYWKPIETGDSDAGRVAALCPTATVHSPLCRFQAALAPALAARMEGKSVPAASVVAGALPRALNGERGVVIESFGGAFSPLTEDELQLALIHQLARPCVLVSSSKLGAIGRTLQCLTALGTETIHPVAVVLLGERDSFAEEQIRRHRPEVIVVSLGPPGEWTADGIRECAMGQRAELDRLAAALNTRRVSPPAKQIIADDRRSVWHPYTPLIGAEEPLICVAAQDEFLELADGRRVIDGISSWWTILHGHRHPPLMQALAEGRGGSIMSSSPG